MHLIYRAPQREHRLLCHLVPYSVSQIKGSETNIMKRVVKHLTKFTVQFLGKKKSNNLYLKALLFTI